VTLDDILIAAPCNVQMRCLHAALPDGRIRTADKFQGQEAPIVLSSMTSSTAKEVPQSAFGHVGGQMAVSFMDRRPIYRP
jgi:superfamily I DNA and/or RNA helicase